ncbi:MAG: AEC family transporter [Rhodospirillaceae bacterium]|nr:AEC family transporter [Rhodospirillaceae bacterium]MBT5456501.1 AEC family transporter [Rhodospirillaceae bacterium]
MSIILDIAAIIAPLFVIAGIGFIWGRSSKPFDTNMIGTLTVNFGVPCLIFSTMTTLKVSLAAFGTIAGAFTVAVIINALIAAIVLRMMRLDVAGYLPGTVFPNNGNMGLPLCLFAFGDEGLALGISIFVISSLGNFTLGMAVVSGKMSPKEIAKTPAIWVTLAALLFLLGDIEPPGWLANTTKIIGGMSIPLMLIALGVSLSRLRIESAGRSLILAVMRLGLGFGIGVLLAWLFGLEGAARGVLILQCAMPAAVINYIIAVRFERCAVEVAGLVVASTLISFATLPLLLYFVI